MIKIKTEISGIYRMTTRKFPAFYHTLAQAKDETALWGFPQWCRIWKLEGVFKIYPGGRTIRYHDRERETP